MKSITDTEFKNKIDLFIDESLDQPIIITSPKRKSLVLISADEYQRLTKFDKGLNPQIKGCIDHNLDKHRGIIKDLAER